MARIGRSPRCWADVAPRLTATPRAALSWPHFLRKASMLTTFGPALGPGSEALGAGSLAGALPRACGRSAPFSGADRRGARGFFSARGPSAVVDALDASP